MFGKKQTSTRLWSCSRSPLISYQLYWVMSALLKITIEMNKWDATMPRATFSAGNAWEKLMHPLPAQDTRWLPSSLPSSPSSSPAQDIIMICYHWRSLKKSKNEQNRYITSSQEWLIKCASIDPEELHSTCQKVHAASKFSICYDPSNTDLLIYLSEGLRRFKGLWWVLIITTATLIMFMQMEDAATCLWLVTNSKVCLED